MQRYLFKIVSILILSIQVMSIFAYSDMKKESFVIGDNIQFSSNVFNENRTIRVVLPKSYQNSNKKYPVLYVLDAEWHLLSAVAAVKYLSETSYLTYKTVPEVIIVGVVNVNRDRDFTPTEGKKMASLWTNNVGKAETTTKFIKNELLPLIDSNYRTSGYDILTGWSYGGLFTVYTAFKHPEIFNAYIAISPSLWWDLEYLVEEIKNNWNPKDLENKTFILTLGEKEKKNFIFKGINDLKEFLEKEAPEGSFKFYEVPKASHNMSPPKVYIWAFKELFNDLICPTDVMQGGFDKVVKYYKEKENKYSIEFKVPWVIWDAFGRSYIKQKKYKETMELYKLRLKEYPNSSFAISSIGDVYMEMGQVDRAEEYYKKAIQNEKSLAQPDVRAIEHLEKVIKELKKQN